MDIPLKIFLGRITAFLFGIAAVTGPSSTSGAKDPLRMSVYCTAGDVQRHLASEESRQEVLRVLRPLKISRLFLEGRRGDEYDHIWVGTEVRDPRTRRMGFVQPTEGYLNFRWLASQAPRKVRGAWFDHIECSARNFVDQAYQSVLAGAAELTLFHLGDLMARHPGDALLAGRLPELCELADRVRRDTRRGIVFYKPSGSESAENLYLASQVLVLNVRTISEQDFRDTGEWLLAPRALGLSEIPQELADELRSRLMGPLGQDFRAPSGVSLHLFQRAGCVYNFRNEPVSLRLQGQKLEVPANGWVWRKFTRSSTERERQGGWVNTDPPTDLLMRFPAVVARAQERPERPCLEGVEYSSFLGWNACPGKAAICPHGKAI